MYELALKEKPTLLVLNYFELQVCVDVKPINSEKIYLLYHKHQMWEEAVPAKSGNMPIRS